MSHRAVRAVQAHVRHALAAAKIKESKDLSKYHTMIMGVGKESKGPLLDFHTLSLKPPKVQKFVYFVVVNTDSILIRHTLKIFLPTPLIMMPQKGGEKKQSVISHAKHGL